MSCSQQRYSEEFSREAGFWDRYSFGIKRTPLESITILISRNEICTVLSVTGKKDGDTIASHKLMEKKVREVMNEKPITVKNETSIDDLLDLMLDQVETCVPVVDDNRKLIGIVTESDLFQTLHPRPRIREALKHVARNVGEMMTKRPVYVTPDMTIAEAMNLMRENKFRRLPVVEGNKLVGLLSLRDIIEFYRMFK